MPYSDNLYSADDSEDEEVVQYHQQPHHGGAGVSAGPVADEQVQDEDDDDDEAAAGAVADGYFHASDASDRQNLHQHPTSVHQDGGSSVTGADSTYSNNNNDNNNSGIDEGSAARPTSYNVPYVPNILVQDPTLEEQRRREEGLSRAESKAREAREESSSAPGARDEPNLYPPQQRAEQAEGAPSAGPLTASYTSSPHHQGRHGRFIPQSPSGASSSSSGGFGHGQPQRYHPTHHNHHHPHHPPPAAAASSSSAAASSSTTPLLGTHVRDFYYPPLGRPLSILSQEAPPAYSPSPTSPPDTSSSTAASIQAHDHSAGSSSSPRTSYNTFSPSTALTPSTSRSSNDDHHSSYQDPSASIMARRSEDEQRRHLLSGGGGGGGPESMANPDDFAAVLRDDYGEEEGAPLLLRPSLRQRVSRRCCGTGGRWTWRAGLLIGVLVAGLLLFVVGTLQLFVDDVSGVLLLSYRPTVQPS